MLKVQLTNGVISSFISLFLSKMDFVDFRETLLHLSIFWNPIESPEKVDFWRSDAIYFWTFVDFRGFLPFKSPKII